MTVIINLVTLNLTTKMNCQVCQALEAIALYPVSTVMTPQGLDHHKLREYTIPPYTSVPDDSECCNILSYKFSDLFIHELCLIFPFNCTSHVSFICSHSSDTLLRRSWHASVAVWNTNKGIVGLVTIVWGINASLSIQGESLSTRAAHSLKPCQTWLVNRYRSGE